MLVPITDEWVPQLQNLVGRIFAFIYFVLSYFLESQQVLRRKQSLFFPQSYARRAKRYNGGEIALLSRDRILPFFKKKKKLRDCSQCKQTLFEAHRQCNFILMAKSFSESSFFASQSPSQYIYWSLCSPFLSPLNNSWCSCQNLNSIIVSKFIQSISEIHIHVFYFSVKFLHNVCWFLGSVRIKQVYPDITEKVLSLITFTYNVV